MPNINKVIYGNTVLIDLTMDTLMGSKLLAGYTAHDKSGAQITGSCTFDSDTTDANATEDTILTGKSAYVNKQKVNGSMPNRGAITGTISAVAQEVSIQNGYHDGSGKVSIASAEQAKIIAGNIKNGVEILGVQGTYSGDPVPPQTKTVTPYTTAQDVEPDEGYILSKVTVQPIAYAETPNTYGTTVTIGTVAPT